MSNKNYNDKKLSSYFLEIIEKSKKDNTYKFALAKALLNISICSESNIIKYEQLAEEFLKYYWYQEIKYKFKQNFQKEKNPEIINIIRKYCTEEYIAKDFKNYFKDYPDKKEKMIEEIVKKVFHDVIPRFDKEQIFYKHNYEKKGKKYKLIGKEEIILNEKTFFKEYYPLLHKIVILEWAKFLEKINFSPKLIKKLETLHKPERNSLSKYKGILLEIDKNRCFYCGKLLNESFDIDHFLPWSFVYEDELWNLVLSCTECNRNIKKDYLPKEECLDKLKYRNKKMETYVKNKKFNWRFDEKKLMELYELALNSGFRKVEKIECDFI